jgi:predicted ATPase
VFDNAEHLIGASDSAALASHLLDLLLAAPRVAMLVTSRQRLGVQAEDVYVLHGLPVPTAQDQADNDAVQLFASRARRASKTFALDASSLPHIVRICGLVGGIPLAIELAAASCARLTCAEVATDVATSLDALQANLHDLPPSHRSIRACFERSWSRCNSVEQTVLMRLGVFHDSFTTSAAVAVCDATPNMLMRLRDYSLLAGDLFSTQRHAIHPLLQTFLREKLRDGGHADMLADRHAAYFHHWISEQEAVLDGDQPGVAMDAMLAEQGNLRAAWLRAVQQHDTAALSASVAPYAQFADEAGHAQQMTALLQAASDTLAVEDNVAGWRARARLLQHLALLVKESERKNEALAHAEHAVRLADMAGDGLLLAGALHATAFAHIRLLQFDAGDAAVQRALGVLALCGDSRSSAKIRAKIHVTRADGAYQRQAFSQCLEHLEPALRLCKAHRLEGMSARIHYQLAVIYSELGQFQAANDACAHAIEFARSNKQHAFANLVQSQRAMMFDMLGDYGQAQRVSVEALAWCRETGNTRGEMIHSTNLGISYDLVGRYDDAIKFTGRSLELCRVVGNDANTDIATVNLSLHHHHIGNQVQARAIALTAIQLSRQRNRNQMLAYGQTMLGHAEAALGNLGDAETAYAAAQALAQAEDLRYLTVEPAAGLARLALQRGERAEALALIEPVLAYLDEHELAGMEEPFRVHLTCMQILQANADPRAGAVLARACDLLTERAARITDLHTRESYLHNVLAHRTLLDLRQV